MKPAKDGARPREQSAENNPQDKQRVQDENGNRET